MAGLGPPISQATLVDEKHRGQWGRVHVSVFLCLSVYVGLQAHVCESGWVSVNVRVPVVCPWMCLCVSLCVPLQMSMSLFIQQLSSVPGPGPGPGRVVEGSVPASSQSGERWAVHKESPLKRVAQWRWESHAVRAERGRPEPLRQGTNGDPRCSKEVTCKLSDTWESARWVREESVPGGGKNMCKSWGTGEG